MQHKRLSLVVSLLVIAGFVILATRQSRGETAFSREEKRMRVLRSKGHEKLKPTAKEITSFKKSIQDEKRELEDQLPKHLPIKIKIKAEKEKAFNDLNNEKWIRDFELEVKNTGDKPIYFLNLILTLPEVRAPDGNQYGFSMNYGNSKLADFSTEPKPEDVPVKPGETHVFKIPARSADGWENFSRREQKSQPRKVRIQFGLLVFGDRTGFGRTDGAPLPRRPQTEGANGACLEDLRNKSDPQRTEAILKLIPRKYSFGMSSTSLLSATFLSANLSANSERSTRVNSIPQSGLCCPGTGCSFLKVQFGRCYCSDPEFPAVNDRRFDISTSCGDPAGQCGTTSSITESCNNPCCNIPLYCTETFLEPCAGSASPTPTPTPSPTPETCDPATRPNSSNCACNNLPGIGLTWQCSCGAVPYADYVQYPQNGGCDPTKQANNGSNCCVCIAQNVPCDPGFTRNSFSCECVQNPVPTPPPRTGAGGGDTNNPIYYCTPYFWVWWVSYDGGETWTATGQVEYAGCF